MKKSLFLISACCLLSGCWPEDFSKYGEILLGTWEVKEITVEISGATKEDYAWLMEEVIGRRFDAWEGSTLEFKHDDIIVGPESEGTYRITDDKLRIRLQKNPADANGEETVYNFVVEQLGSRSLTMTWDAVWEWPQLDVLMPGLTKCQVTVKATKKSKLKPESIESM